MLSGQDSNLQSSLLGALPIELPDYCLSFPCIVILIPKNVKNTTTKINPIIINFITLIF